MRANRRWRVFFDAMPLFVGGLVEEVDQRNQLRIGHRRGAVRPVVEDGEWGGQADGDLLASETRNDELQQTLTGVFLHRGRILCSPRRGYRAERSAMDKLAFYFSTEWPIQKKSPDWRSPYFRACVSNPEEEVKRDSIKVRAGAGGARVACRS